MKLKAKLLWGFGTILALMTALLILLVIMLSQQNKDMYEIVKYRYEKYRLATEIASESNAIARQARDFLLDPSSLNQEGIDSIKKSKLNVLTAMSALMKLANPAEEAELITKLQSAHEGYGKGVEQSIALIQEGNLTAANQVLVEGVKQERLDIVEATNRLKGIEHQAMVEVLTQSNNAYLFTVKLTFVLFALTLLLGIIITIWVIKGITRSVHRVSTAIASVSEGYTDQLPRIEVLSNDEFGRISKAFNTMAQAIEEHTRQEEEFREILQDQNWVETKISEITTHLQEVQDLETLGSLIITTLTPIVKANYGVIYLTEGDHHGQRLKRLSAYAYDAKAEGADGFNFGEGLVGQCASDHRRILLGEIPENYLRIQSGLGAGSPKNLLLLPIEFEGKVRAVIELASFQEFTPLQLTLLDRLSATIGITLDNVARQMQVKKLLEQSQALTEELQAQSEELQLQHEELRSINEQLEKQYSESEHKTKELEKTKLALEEKAKQLAINSQYKSEFLANMSHELRTPLNSMLILAQMLAENKEGNLKAKQVEYAHAIHLSGKDLLNLINDVLDLAKVESGKMEITPTAVDLAEFLTYLERQFRPIAERKGVSFTVELDRSLPPTVFTDEHRVMQILKNLLSNAFKFTEKGQVLLHLRQPHKQDLLKSNVPPSTALVVVVKDTGIGIANDKQNIIFEAFQQADGTMSRKYGGTGLGLSISREIAQALGGSIEVESVEGQGSTFTLYLPPYFSQTPKAEPTEIQGANTELEPELPSGQVKKTRLAPSLSESGSRRLHLCTQKLLSDMPRLDGKTVLIVDDDMRNIFALTTLLESQGMKVLIAENGQESLEILTANPEIDLVLMDIMMPEMDGYTAMQTIRQMPEFKTLPMIALTAKAMKNDREKCIEAGASDYISKPINIDQLLSLIQVWLYR